MPMFAYQFLKRKQAFLLSLNPPPPICFASTMLLKQIHEDSRNARMNTFVSALLGILAILCSGNLSDGMVRYSNPFSMKDHFPGS